MKEPSVPVSKKPLFLDEVEILFALGAVSGARHEVPECFSLALSNGEIARSDRVKAGKESLLEKLMEQHKIIQDREDAERRQRSLFDTPKKEKKCRSK